MSPLKQREDLQTADGANGGGPNVKGRDVMGDKRGKGPGGRLSQTREGVCAGCRTALGARAEMWGTDIARSVWLERHDLGR